MDYSQKVKCQRYRCESSYPDSKWGKVRAYFSGWFLQKDGTAWCPKHIPSWVSVWRKKKKQETVRKPCQTGPNKWNSNICMAEGCFDEACLDILKE